MRDKFTYEEELTLAVALCSYVRNCERFLSDNFEVKDIFAERIISSRSLIHKLGHITDFCEKELKDIFTKAEQVYKEANPNEPLPFTYQPKES